MILEEIGASLDAVFSTRQSIATARQKIMADRASVCAE